MSEKLNFDNDDLRGFDAANSADGADLSGFDAATGATFIPAGTYLCRLDEGKLVLTRGGKTAYRVRFSVVEPVEHAGFTLWRYFVLDNPANNNRAKQALAPLGLTTAADLRRWPFPETGRVLLCRVVVGVQAKPDGSTGNDVIRFTVERDDRPPANPFAVPLDPMTPDAGEGVNA